MKHATSISIKREKIYEPFWRTIIRTSLTGLAISLAFSLGRLKNAADFQTGISILLTTLVYIGGVIVFLGHYTELFFINYLRFKFANDRITEIFLRFIYWYVSGCLLFNLAVWVRGMLEHKTLFVKNWWMGGIYFIALELIVNFILQLTIKKKFLEWGLLATKK